MDKSNKRKLAADDTDEDDVVIVEDSPSKKPKCKYGMKCYRQNPSHFAEYSHGDNDDDNHNHNNNVATKDIQPSPTKSSNKLIKLSSAIDAISSHRIYLTKVHRVPNSVLINQDISLSLKDILALDQDEFIESAQFNYMHDVEWLREQYPVKNRDKPLMMIHGGRSQSELGPVEDFPNIKVVKAKLDSPYGTHHTKMMFLRYKRGMRVVVHTANLIEQDWSQKTQGIWISDLFPLIDPDAKARAGPNMFDSKTNFKTYLLVYLEAYNDKSLNEWIEHIKKHDMLSAKVFLVGSVPGRFPSSNKAFGHLRLRKILNQHFNRAQDDVALSGPDHLIGQFSSIGSLGPSEQTWLCKEFSASLSSVNDSSLKTNKISPLKLIYPTVENVRTSYEGYSAGGSLPYSKNTAVKQQYLKKFLYKWKSESCRRSRASPHIKSYLRCSNDFKNIYWFLLTSANLSKAAWGNFEKNESQYLIRSYELGVLFIPSLLNNDGKIFFEKDNQSQFLVPYDLPPEKYDNSDEPWIVDISYVDKEDSHQRLWKIL